jgi:hypothetical protein
MLAVPVLAAEQKAEQEKADRPGGVVVEAVSFTATVDAIDSKTRTITLKGTDGTKTSFIAGDEVRNFAQIKKGDIVEVDYRRAAATALEKASDATVAGQAATVERAPAGAKPGMMATQTSTIVATVLEIDQKNRVVTLQGPKGGIVMVAVPADMKAFDSLKKGDKVSAIYSEAMAISVKTPAKKK